MSRPLPVRIAGRLRYWLALAKQAYRVHGWKPRDLDPESRAYRRHVAEEIEHYGALFEKPAGSCEPLFEPAPAVWDHVQDLVSGRIRERTGHDVLGHLISRMRHSPGRRMMSLGSGPGGIELLVASQAPEGRYLCHDLNAGLLEQGRTRAKEQGLPVEFAELDLNTAELPAASCDVIFCHASLHHLVKLERIADQIAQALKPEGELVVVDLCTRNGYRMWPENRELVRKIWETLPDRLRVNHTAYPQPRVDRRIWEVDTRSAGMECMRVEDVLPVLDSRFVRSQFVPHSGLVRRFFDSMYGPNYDLARPLDRAIVEWIWQLDCELVDKEAIRPETFFSVFRPRPG